MTKSLKQRSTNDCAITCLAMFLDCPYSVMRRIVMAYFLRCKKKFDGMYYTDEKAIGQIFGEEFRVWHVTAKNRKKIVAKLVGRPALVTVPSINCEKSNHAVYWDGRMLHDPSKLKRYGESGERAMARMLNVIVMAEHERYCSLETV